MNTMKKLASILLIAAMVLTLAACGGKPAETKAPAADTQQAQSSEAPAAPTKQIVIGIGEAQANDEVAIRRKYLESFIGPRYNVKFIFSERLSDDSLTREFIQNCADAGAVAVIDFKTCSGLMARLCQENGMIYTTNGNLQNAPELTVASDFPLYAGNVSSNNDQTGRLFKDWLESVASADGHEGFLVATMIASQGNAQHGEITRAILKGLQEKYGLTYEQDIEALVLASDTTNVANDKDILITLYPGSSSRETWLPGVSSLLQTGKYGVFMSAGQTYPCDFFSLDEWRLGRIGEQTLMEMAEGETARRFLAWGREKPAECLSCRWRTLCNGGCKNDWKSEADGSHNYYCRAFQMLFEHAEPRMLRIAQAERTQRRRMGI